LATPALLLELGTGISDNAKAAGSKEQVDPIKRLLLTAYGLAPYPRPKRYYSPCNPTCPLTGAMP